MKKSPNSIDIHVGSRIRLRRTMLGMSQERLSDGLGITFQQVQKYEKGANRVGASRLQSIAELLNVPITFFFDGSPGVILGEEDAELNRVSAMMGSRECIALATAFSAIEDKRVRQSILNLVRSLSPASVPVEKEDEAHAAHW